MRAHLRHASKRLHALPHALRGYVAIDVGGFTVTIRAETGIRMEETRRNAHSEARWIADLLDNVRGKSFLDIGAGYGTESILAAKAGAEAVTAVEADQARRGYIRVNAAENDTPLSIKGWRVGDGKDDTVSIDAENLSPEVVKIDVEGSEWKALLGMAETVRTVNRLYLELHPSMLPPGVSATSVMQWLVNNGFDLRERSMEGRTGQRHIIAVHPDAPDHPAPPPGLALG